MTMGTSTEPTSVARVIARERPPRSRSRMGISAATSAWDYRATFIAISSCSGNVFSAVSMKGGESTRCWKKLGDSRTSPPGAARRPFPSPGHSRGA